jgi:hypothetical protein
VYQKPAMMFKHLESYLGIDEFDRIMQLYFETWKFRHPQPEDLKMLFEQESGRDLGWLFDDLLNTTGKINYAIRSIRKLGNDLQVNVRNKGDINSPFPIAVFREGQRMDQQWVEGFSGTQPILFPGMADADYVVIDADTVTLDINPGIGRSRTDGLFKRAGYFRVRFPGAVEDPDYKQLFVIPAIGANTSDNLMLGAGFYNRLFPEKRFNYFIMPMYSFGLQRLAGSAEINYNVFPDWLFRRIRFTALAKSYAGYRKAEPRVEFAFKPRSFKYSPDQRFFFRYSFVNVDLETLPIYEENRYGILEGRYSLDNDTGLWRYGFSTGLRNKMGDFLSWDSDLMLSWQYFRNSFISARVFYGQFLQGDGILPAFQFGLSGSFDYMMDDVFLDRAGISHDFTGFEVQTNLRHGGFRGWVPIMADSWMTTINLDVDIPFIGLFNLFADVGWTGNTTGMLYDAGIRFQIIRNVLEFYFPVVGDPYEGTFPETFRDFTSQMRFRLRMNNINPLNTLYRR